ncbi:hypothetical protein MWU65_06320 [Cellulophaga sp. F20128]|uniref:hypothetical protein n=1 Tax=Cellulophaga sp. F20128 TaxID=2926413 RepID=UPI001FF4A083|nr:hypothetical protein [Cellulophaga sp. F20128]MCK0156786.1 hypothetical protein [Cellulophaga sp. F20128]
MAKGNLESLAGGDTIAFLGVMILFGFGNILLKIKREKLPRPEVAGWRTLIVAIVGVVIALTGNLILNPDDFIIFIEYYR